jgi:hypothetical protein
MYSFVSYTGNGVQTDYAVPFPYILQSHVVVLVDSVAGVYTWLNASTIRFTVAPANGAVIDLQRNSNRIARIVDFADSSTLTEDNLDLDSTQLMYVAQEALDQSTAGVAFSTDAQGSRVVNVADPIADSDAATKGWVGAYVSSITTTGLDLLPLSNDWTGTLNQFQHNLSIGPLGSGCVFDPTDLATTHALKTTRSLFVHNVTNGISEVGYGLQAYVERSSGFDVIVGAQLDAWGKAASQWVFGAALEAVQTKAAGGPIIGLESATINLNSNDSVSPRIAISTIFKNRDNTGDVGGTGGSAVTGGLIAGDGTGGNWYNANSAAWLISAQDRSDAGATFCGWNRGLRLYDKSFDEAKVPAYNGATQYQPGDYVTSAGHVFINKESSAGIAPAIGSNTNWADMGVGSTRKAIILDLSSYGATQAGRLIAPLKLRGDAPMVWDTEEHISTRFDTNLGRWTLKNDATERIGLEVSTGNVWVNGVPRILGVQSAISVHRNFVATGIVGTNTWNIVNYTTVDTDPRGEFNTSIGRFTAGTPGYYRITHQAQTESNATAGASFFAGIAKNGGLRKAGNVICVGSVPNTARADDLVFLNAGDYIEGWTLLNTGSAGITGEPAATYLIIHKAP